MAKQMVEIVDFEAKNKEKQKGKTVATSIWEIGSIKDTSGDGG